MRGVILSKIVLVFQNDQFLDYFSTLITGVTDLEIVSFTDAVQANAYCLKESNSVVLNLVQGSCEASRGFINNLLEQSVARPLIILGEKEELRILRKTYKSQTLLDYFDLYGSADELFKKIEKLLSVSARSQTEKVYCKVNLSFFYSTKEVFCDVYIKIGEEKYLKVLNRYDVVDPTDIKKFDKKNIKHLYVRKRDFSLITKKLVEQLKPHGSGDSALMVTKNDALTTVFSIQLQETVSETIQKIGLSDEAVQMTNIAINSTMELVEREPEIYQLLQNSIKGQNYSSEHSFLLSFLACSLLKETSLESPENLSALTISAFFHDVSINEDFCQIQSKEEMAYKSLGLKEQEEVINHPAKARKLVESIEGIPRNVGTIIIQHHEKYDGTGFPMGLDYKRISPLSAIFNVAHELSQYIYESGNSSENIKSILDYMQERYQKGNYATAVQAAVNVFSETKAVAEPLKKVV